MVGNIIFSILTITTMSFGMVNNAPTQELYNKANNPSIIVNLDDLKTNHTYEVEITTNATKLLELDSIISNVNYNLAIAIKKNENEKYIGFTGDAENNYTDLLYTAQYKIDLKEIGNLHTKIKQFTYDNEYEINIDTYNIFDYLTITDITQGGQIIGSIASGLGLIGNLVNEFSNGFKAMFWTGSKITSFGTFALIMLGVSISFAVIKLILYIIRNKSGT